MNGKFIIETVKKIMELQINEDQTAGIQSRKTTIKKINDKMTEWVHVVLMNIRLLIEMYYLNSLKVIKFQMNKDQTA